MSLDLEQELAKMVTQPQAMPAGADPGVESITRTGEISAKAFVAAIEEAATRAEAAGTAALEEGQRVKKASDQLAKDLRSTGELFAKTMTDFSLKTSKIADSQARSRDLMLGSPERFNGRAD